ncbi:MAG: thermonuclease family protein [Gammaproteobacteria bacterium]|nr:thermonuclease family protein [Gammaproteobacteria bacterium]
MSAFFYAPVGLAFTCPTEHFDESAIVKSVHDGDTLTLNDGRKIRLIGINTPELARKNQPAEPYAEQARQALDALVKQAKHNIKLVYGIDRTDKYQRTLAHIYLPDGNNIQAHLISKGLATAFTTPPNDSQSNCYKQLETIAIKQKTGIWSLAEYQVKQPNQLTKHSKGFHRIEARVSQIRQSKNAFWINLHGDIHIRIQNRDLKYFDMDTLLHLKDKIIIVRGWLHPKKNSFFMHLRHPDAFSLISQPAH